MDEAPTVAEGDGGDEGARRDDLAGGGRLGRYIVLERIGAGGMGIVYAAYDPELDRKIAVKLLKPRDGGTRGTEQQRLRLVREAQAMARLSHPNVITVLDVGTIEGSVFIAMEFVDGTTLSEWLDERRPWRQVVRALCMAGRGLAAAHAAELVHRDFKPDNVLVGRDGRVCVTDFGLARELGSDTGETDGDGGDADAGPPRRRAGSSPLSTPVTRTGALLGTPAYMSPEQHQARPTDERTDQFSFCVALYEGLYGEPPFPGDTAAEIGIRVLAGDIAPVPRDSDVPGWLRKVVLRGLAREPDDRFRSMEALLAALSRDPSAARRRWLMGGMAAFAVVAALLVISLGVGRSAGDAVCQGARADFDAAWSDERRAAAEAAFAGSQLPFAGAAWSGVEAALNDYRARWVDMRTRACRATREKGVQSDELLDLRMRCLDRRLGEVEALAAVLAAPDAKVIENAAAAARSLTSLDGCANTEALLERVPPPEDAAVRADIDAVRAALAGAKALNDAGKVTEAHAAGVAAVARALDIDYAPLRAEALYLRGDLENAVEDDETAASTLRDAVYWAELARDDELSARASNLLVYVLGYKLKDFDRALFWARYAESKIRRLGGADDIEAGRLQRLGIVQQEKGDLDGALQSYERALAMREEQGAETSTLLASIAGVYSSKGEFERARQLYERAVELKEVAYGIEHVAVAGALNNLGTIYNRLGRGDEAMALFVRIEQLYARATGPDSPGVGLSLANQAGVHMRRGHYAEAEAALARSLEIYTRERGPDHPDTAHSVGTLAIVYAMQGKLAEAEVQFRRVVDINTAIYGEDHAETAYAINNLGTVLLDQAKYDDALVRLERALELKEKHLGPDHAGVATTLEAIARIFVERRRFGDAETYYARAVAIREKAYGADNVRVAVPLTALGQLELARSNPRAAIEPTERALVLREHATDVTPAELADTRYTLARALWASGGDRSRAVSLAAQARDGYAEAGAGSEDELGEVRAWLAGRVTR